MLIAMLPVCSATAAQAPRFELTGELQSCCQTRDTCTHLEGAVCNCYMGATCRIELCASRKARSLWVSCPIAYYSQEHLSCGTIGVHQCDREYRSWSFTSEDEFIRSGHFGPQVVSQTEGLPRTRIGAKPFGRNSGSDSHIEGSSRYRIPSFVIVKFAIICEIRSYIMSDRAKMHVCNPFRSH